jgi:phage baseplate assembly protein W
MDISFYVMDTPDGIALEMVYDAAILAGSRVEDMLRQYGSLLAQIVEQPAAKLTEYAL